MCSKNKEYSGEDGYCDCQVETIFGQKECVFIPNPSKKLSKDSFCKTGDYLDSFGACVCTNVGNCKYQTFKDWVKHD